MRERECVCVGEREGEREIAIEKESVCVCVWVREREKLKELPHSLRLRWEPGPVLQCRLRGCAGGPASDGASDTASSAEHGRRTGAVRRSGQTARGGRPRQYEPLVPPRSFHMRIKFALFRYTINRCYVCIYDVRPLIYKELFRPADNLLYIVSAIQHVAQQPQHTCYLTFSQSRAPSGSLRP